jgi:hypothetical protein
LTPCRTRLLRVCHFRNVPTVVAGPSQNRACAIYAHGSSHGQFTENPSLLCGAISLPLVPRFCERPVFPHTTLPCVASFPPAALPAFFGTTRLSDSLCFICLPPSSVVRHTLDTPKETQGLPGCRVLTMSNMPWSPTPGSSHHLAIYVDDCFDFHLLKNVVLPTRKITGLNPFNLSAYGLFARYPTLKTLCYHKASKDSLPGGWPTFRDGIHTRLTTRPCPAALNIFPIAPS